MDEHTMNEQDEAMAMNESTDMASEKDECTNCGTEECKNCEETVTTSTMCPCGKAHCSCGKGGKKKLIIKVVVLAIIIYLITLVI